MLDPLGRTDPLGIGSMSNFKPLVFAYFCAAANTASFRWRAHT
jgi:hypothetical protein